MDKERSTESGKFLRFVNRLDAVMEIEGITQAELCRQASVGRPILNHYLSHKIDRPAPKFLKAICSAFQHGPAAVQLVSEHLRDELDRAGFRPKDFTISHGDTATHLSPRLISLAEAAARSKGWADAIKALAAIAAADAAKGYPAGDAVSAELSRVAEPPPPFYKGKSKRKATP